MLQEIGKAHWELCKLANNINIVFGVQNLLFMVISVIVTTGLLYTIYVAYMLEDEMFNNLTAIIQPLAWTTIYIYKIWVINHSCGRASNEAQRTGEVIYGLMKPCAQDQGLQTKIQEFSVQILQNPVQFDVCGFFIMNYTFIQAVIGYITTYLIILIQMTEAPKIQASNHSAMTPEVEQKNKVQ
ncbi:putative gustatory receptor 28b [Neodiprion fabricii]|uniref:putative gustatory receptor 28b n=1 Tax=Neodiprion fabricii TaxID=2872261 RepID=UPI001ED93342|nr:putative gustatory receptor 28b [Neodiprion fabricii]